MYLSPCIYFYASHSIYRQPDGRMDTQTERPVSPRNHFGIETRNAQELGAKDHKNDTSQATWDCSEPLEVLRS